MPTRRSRSSNGTTCSHDQDCRVRRREEIVREHRVADQMVTMYSALCDRYARRATALTLGVLGSGVILATATFLHPNDLGAWGISENALRLVTGCAAAVVFFASLAELTLRWRERSQAYRDAATRVARVKAEAREALVGEDEIDVDQFKELATKFSGAMHGLPGIPDPQFVSLKAYHKRKVQLSRMCDTAVGCPVWILRVRLLVSGIRAALRGSGAGDS
jgi:hypothetical protein